MKIFAKFKGKYGNEIEAYQVEITNKNSIIIHDKDCQLSRKYTLGKIQELDNFNMVIISSFKQVINAWKKGTIWF